MLTLNNTQIKLIHPNYKNGNWELPKYKTVESAGFDLRAAIDSPIRLDNQSGTIKIPLGLAIWLNSPGYMTMLVPKSGLGCNHGLQLTNTVGIIDSDYQGEWKVCIRITHDDSDVSLLINPGDFICQAIITPIIKTNLCNIVDEFSYLSERGVNGGINRNGA
jgi:dUTP pyrophosphatase